MKSSAAVNAQPCCADRTHNGCLTSGKVAGSTSSPKSKRGKSHAQDVEHGRVTGILAVTLAACSNEPDLDASQTSDGTDTIELAEFPDRPYLGDTHLHTDNSVDAFGFGVRLGPEEALRFARGKRFHRTTAQQAQLARPLDFSSLPTIPMASAQRGACMMRRVGMSNGSSAMRRCCVGTT